MSCDQTFLAKFPSTGKCDSTMAKYWASLVVICNSWTLGWDSLVPPAAWGQIAWWEGQGNTIIVFTDCNINDCANHRGLYHGVVLFSTKHVKIWLFYQKLKTWEKNNQSSHCGRDNRIPFFFQWFATSTTRKASSWLANHGHSGWDSLVTSVMWWYILLIMCVQLSFSTKHIAGRTIIIRSPIRVPKICYLQRGLRSRWCCNPWTRIVFPCPSLSVVFSFFF